MRSQVYALGSGKEDSSGEEAVSVGDVCGEARVAGIAVGEVEDGKAEAGAGEGGSVEF
jgi:hypothetical protein